jgi:phasin family protein
MFTTIPKILTTTIEPFNRLIEINTKSFEQLLNLQKTFITAICWEVAAQTKALSTQTDFAKAVDDQKYYTDQLQEKMSTSVKDVCEVATKSSDEVVDLVTGSISEVVNATK